MKIGLFGGSFNPIHIGHIYLAESIKNSLHLDRVILIPSKRSPHKNNDEYVSDVHRVNMCQLAIQDMSDFEISDYEILHDTTSYTIYTVRYFKAKYPTDLLYLLVGSDMFLSFNTWREYIEIMQNVTIVVVSRHDGDMNNLLKKAEELRRYGKIIVLNIEPIEVSSTEIRKNIRNSIEYSCNLNEKVVQYIESNNLYQD